LSWPGVDGSQTKSIREVFDITETPDIDLSSRVIRAKHSRRGRQSEYRNQGYASLCAPWYPANLVYLLAFQELLGDSEHDYTAFIKTASSL